MLPPVDVRLHLLLLTRIELAKLGKKMSTRQQALATAQVYLKRFYTKVEFQQTNPYQVLTTAFYLACKMEECPQHIRFVVTEAKGLWPGMGYPSNVLVSSFSLLLYLGICHFHR
jgi:Cyclin, N-terminal domain